MEKKHKEPVREEVRQEFEEAAQRGSGGPRQLREKLHQHHSTSPALSGGDVDAAWEDAAVGEESVGGANPTPDQNVVDELGIVGPGQIGIETVLALEPEGGTEDA